MPEIDNQVQEGKFFAVIAYISFLCIVTLLLKKDNRFAVYHAKYGLVLFVFEVAVFLLSIIPFFFWPSRLIFMVLGLVSLWGIMQSLLGNYSRIPYLGQIADKIIL